MDNNRFEISGLLFTAIRWKNGNVYKPIRFICHVGEVISILIDCDIDDNKWRVTCDHLGFNRTDIVGIDFSDPILTYDKIITMTIAMCTTRRYLINREFEAALKER